VQRDAIRSTTRGGASPLILEPTELPLYRW
jgi:hypothetical protein